MPNESYTEEEEEVLIQRGEGQNTMRINFVLPFTGVSGGVRAVFELTNGLIDKGHDVNVLYPVIPHQPAGSTFAPGKVKSQLSSGINRLSQGSEVDWFELKSDVQRIPALSLPSRILELFIPDADITVATAWQTAYPVARLGPSKGKKFYFMQHYEIWPLWDSEECWEQAITNNRAEPGLEMVDIAPDSGYLQRYKRLVDESYKLPLDIITTSEWENEVIEKIGEKKTGSIKCGVDFDGFQSSVETPEIEILALYRNKKHKGDPQAINSFRKMNSRIEDVNFIMFGTNQTSEIPDFVEFHESPEQETIRDLYSRSDIFVYPSWVEGFGMPPMEAMACQNAVVSTNVGAVKEYSPKDTVRFVPVRDAEGIVKEVEYLVENENEIERIKRQCFEYIQRFTWERATNSFESILQRELS